MDRQHLLSDQDDPAAVSVSSQQYRSTTNTAPSSQADGNSATAPPAELMDVVPGYEGIGVAGDDLPPPNPGFQQPEPPPIRSSDAAFQIPSISEDLAQEVFIEYASKHCCYSTKPAREMFFTDLQPLNTYRYRLETFTESRSTKWASEPFFGQIVDGYMGVVPGPWDVIVPPASMFQNASQDVRIPHTSSVKGCHVCVALGKTACKKCITCGMMQCGVCHGSGRRMSNDRCSRCNGIGRVRCTSCSGMGSVTCKTCDGKGKLLCYLKLTVKWKNNIHESVVDKQSGFPINKVSKVTGEVVYGDQNLLVYPIVGFPDEVVNQCAAKAVREHQAQFSNACRILQQRQTVELIPITRVHYNWNQKTYIYFVYGAEHKVFSEDYPAKCSCCSVL